MVYMDQVSIDSIHPQLWGIFPHEQIRWFWGEAMAWGLQLDCRGRSGLATASRLASDRDTDRCDSPVTWSIYATWLNSWDIRFKRDYQWLSSSMIINDYHSMMVFKNDFISQLLPIIDHCWWYDPPSTVADRETMNRSEPLSLWPSFRRHLFLPLLVA